jgi:chemotaxis protein methyltransferase CheR
MPAAVTEPKPLTEAQFQQISTLVKGLCGINLHDGKRELVKARLAKRIRQLGIASFADYLDMVRSDPSAAEVTAMLDSLSTNLTYFFREPAHIDYLRETVVPTLLTRNADSKSLRIWSAGCSSGEEPYTIGMTLLHHFPELRSWDVRILATDLSTRVLAKAREGVYGPDRLRQVPAGMVSTGFAPAARHSGGQRHVSDAVRTLVTFGRLNLMESWPMKGPFDVIFCRNVMIYFDKATQDRLVQRYWEILAPGGWLMVGHSESLSGIRHQFKYVQPATYQK